MICVKVSNVCFRRAAVVCPAVEPASFLADVAAKDSGSALTTVMGVDDAGSSFECMPTSPPSLVEIEGGMIAVTPDEGVKLWKEASYGVTLHLYLDLWTPYDVGPITTIAKGHTCALCMMLRWMSL